MTNYYELLSVESSAPATEIRRAFRQEIARYHPDKVHHLGKEFQEMAATRAAQLTEAYRTLMNTELRAEYDRLLAATQPVVAPPPDVEAPVPAAAKPAAAPTPSAAQAEPIAPRSTQYSEELNSKDEFVKKATLQHLRKILKDEFGTCAEIQVRGFDLVCATTRARLFGRSKTVPNLFVRLVRQVTSAAIEETWAMAARALETASPEVCVLLLGNIQSHREANEAVAALKRQPGRRSKEVVLLPVDIRDWSTQVPSDVPHTCRSLVDKLKKSR